MIVTSPGAGAVPEHPRQRWTTVLAWTLAMAGASIALLSLLVWASQDFPRLPQSFSRTPTAIVPNVALTMTCLAVGALLGDRAPRNAVGWLLLATGLALAPVLPAALIVAEAYETFQPASPVTRLVAWLVSSFSTSIVLGSLALAALLFPDGRLSSGWSRGSAVLAVGGAVLFGVSLAVDPVGLVWYPTIANPMAAPPDLAPVVDGARLLATVLIVAAVAALAASVVHRYRTGDAVTRAQLRWIVFGVMVFAASFVPFVVARYALAVSDATGEGIAAAANLGAIALPVAAAFAITRYRLFGVDRLVSRTLVYVPLLGILGGLYAAAVALFQRLFVALTGEPSDVPLLLATFVAAAAFTPVRKAMEGFVEGWAHTADGAGATGAVGTVQGSESGERDGAGVAAVPAASRVSREGEPDDAELRRTAATLAAIGRLEARLTAGTVALEAGGGGATLPIDEAGTVACPAGQPVPFSTCLGCPYLMAMTTLPPEVRCQRASPAEAVSA